jgi:hypothetical protein
MPRGSQPGERRGGRQRATPNRRTVLINRILAAAAALCPVSGGPGERKTHQRARLSQRGRPGATLPG